MFRIIYYILLFSLLAGVILTWPLWLNERAIPIAPVIGWLVTTGWYHGLLLGVSCVVFLGMLTPKQSVQRVFVPVFVALCTILILQDQTRLQPWFYQYLIMLLLYAAYLIGKIKASSLHRSYQTILICVYFWSGIHKINVSFVKETYPDVIGFTPELLGWAIPIIEVTLACLLLFGRTRKVGVTGLIIMHIGIIMQVLFGEMDHNMAIIPWNISMIVFLILLFRKSREHKRSSSVSKIFEGLTFFVVGVLPILNFAGLWDSYPSFSLYSGKTDKAFLYVSEDFKTRYFSEQMYPEFDDQNGLFLPKWYFTELHIPGYPEERVIRDVSKRMCLETENEFDLILEIQTKKDLFSEDWQSETYFCDEL